MRSRTRGSSMRVIFHDSACYPTLMSLAFRTVSAPPLRDFDAAAPDGVVIGVIGEDGSGKGRLLRLAAGLERPASGKVEAPEGRLLLADSALDLEPTPLLCIEHTLARHDALHRHAAAISLEDLRRGGTTVLLVSHEEELLRILADEIWWIHDGRLAGRGDPEEMLGAYRKHMAARIRAWGEMARGPLCARFRRGDGRAEVTRVETLGENGCPT